MDPINPTAPDPGITLRQAALTAGFALLVMGSTPFAEFMVYQKMVVAGDIEATVANIIANKKLYIAGLFGYFVTFVGDIVVAWALYILLRPANHSISLLAAWFRLVYTVIAFVAVLKLATVFRLLETPAHLSAFGADELNAQVQLLLSSFRYEWCLGLVLFGFHLILLGLLVYRSGYVPKLIGILLIIAGLGYPTFYLSPYLYPDIDLEWVMLTFFAELIFMLWLLIRGWSIQGAGHAVA